MQIVCV